MGIELTREAIREHGKNKLEELADASVSAYMEANAGAGKDEPEDKKSDENETDDKKSDESEEKDEESESDHLTESTKYRIYLKNGQEKEFTMTSSQLGDYINKEDVIAVDDLNRDTKYTIKKNKLIKL